MVLVLVWYWYGIGTVLVWRWYGVGTALVWRWYGVGTVLVCHTGMAYVWFRCVFLRRQYGIGLLLGMVVLRRWNDVGMILA